MEAVEIFNFIKTNWSQILLSTGAIGSYFMGKQASDDKHKHSESLRRNLDIDSFTDSFNLSQKILTTVRAQLDSTQELLDKANESYDILEIEFKKALAQSEKDNIKIKSLGNENKELMKRLNTCEFDCVLKRGINENI